MRHSRTAHDVLRSGTAASSPWATGYDTAAVLGISERTLARWRSAGLLKPGKHWRRKFPSQNSPVLYDIPAVDRLMREMAARDINVLEVIEGA